MKYVIRRWYDIGLAMVVPVAVWAVEGDLLPVQRILLLNFAVLLLHQFEEMRWLGGSPGF
ncbi:hypothetical protein [Bosea sp. NBC_00550]|uniref:hypothetical protein n=1 Tax=Bosea sp. NBC_00550 TaxID=2969621 RepID=UPI00223036D0|nr:hypothetical protein [Bosea sp. NBC_00550]UZF94267.1 hypothetical protein NWE53_08800 [Bosea sp. NBC_00550]